MNRLAQATIEGLKKERETGVTIPELVIKYELSKGTIWHHVKNIELGKEARSRIQARRGGSRVRSEKHWQMAREEAATILSNFKEELSWPAILASLYWAEGTKRSGFVFTNTDERMIRVFMKIMREHLQVHDDHFDILIRTCTPMDPLKCRKYWSKILNLPLKNVRINHNNVHNKSKTTYGMCRITLRRGAHRLKLVNCLIEQITDKMLAPPNGSSRSSMDRTPHS
jgi:hypothetical protein